MSGYGDIRTGNPAQAVRDQVYAAATERKAGVAVAARAIREGWDRALLVEMLQALGLGHVGETR